MSSESGGHTSHNHISNQRFRISHTRSLIPRLLSFLANNVVGRCIFPTAPSRSSAPAEVDGLAKDTVMEEHSVCIQEEHREEQVVGRVTVTIDILPDEILLEIFRFYQVGGSSYPPLRAQKRHALLHVCRRWRAIVFSSPRGLDLRILCTARSQVKEMLDAWPTVPIEIWGSFFTFFTPPTSEDERVDNIIAALRHNDRICKIEFEGYLNQPLERIAAATKEPFPGLTHLRIDSSRWNIVSLVIPEAFLGGSAPRLRSCIIVGFVYFRELSKLLSTANHLVILLLNGIPPSTCISPEAMVTLLSGMPKLEELFLLFWRYSGQTNRHPPIRTHVVLPALTRFWFYGYSDYIEDLCSRINAPLLDNFSFSFFSEPNHTPHIHDFLNRSTQLPEAHNLWPLTPESLEYYHKRLW